ncbi:alanyl-tRNA deacylase AlaX-M [Halolamina pelagica]|uniref:Alanyl-tRNA deacylase AlaX-M n=1 Tax=Halolamina pelagica TaxID=699431 RepID=A0A0P7GB59_9EURY|nr:alanyl-tRNA editing protein [Halolamina pelagica]KPN30802.1 alanyl-tRNA deacylase AlaX-M [Halolamina pelagica]
MTEQPYLEDATVREFEATVERTVSDDRVVLDRTHFYPEGGGQPADRGTITGTDGREWAVVDVQKHDGIHHYLEPGEGVEAGELPDAGSTVTGVLDWERRYSHMRYHTAQHLLSALLLEEYDAETTGNQVRAHKATLDCAYERFHDDELAHIERRMNELVEQARAVDWYVLDRSTAEERLDPERTRLSLLPDSITEIRIVEVGPDPASDDDEPFDRTACAGTHVSNTEEIGAVTVTGRETKGSEEERITFELD